MQDNVREDQQRRATWLYLLGSHPLSFQIGLETPPWMNLSGLMDLGYVLQAVLV
jgi:hypothetical protein